MPVDPDIEREAVATVDQYYAALNAGDEEGIRDAFHYPHIRIGAAGNLTTYATREDFQFSQLLKSALADGWHHSAWDKTEVVFTTVAKAHIQVNFTRYREDDSIIGHYFSLYVITFRDGRWGIHAGSGDGT